MVDFSYTTPEWVGMQQQLHPGDPQYATPSQIKSIYDYSNALLHGSGQQPVHSWEQGVSNMVSALVGGNMNYEGGQRERASELHDAAAKVSGLEGTGAFGNDYPNVANNNNPDAANNASRAIASEESAGSSDPYKALGPVTKSGDRAYGKYQVMGANIPEWTKEATGTAYTPEQFLNNPKIQEAVFKTKFLGDYVPKYGYDGAARAWFGGEGGMNNPNASDANGKTVSGYANDFDTRMAGGNPTAVAMLSALRGGAQPPQAAPTSNSPFGGTQGAPGGAGPAVQPVTARTAAAPPYYPEPAGNTGKPYINPALIHPLTNYNEQNLTNVMASQWLPANERDEAFHQAMVQGQPAAIPYMGGVVLINRRNPSAQQFIPNVTWQTKKIGDISVPFAAIPDGRGGFYDAPIASPSAGTPQAAGSPAAAPTVAPQAAPTASPATIQASVQSPSAAPASPANAPAKPPVEVASLDPTAGAAEAAKEEGQPGVIPTEAETPQTASATAGAPQVAPAAGAASPGATSPLTQLAANDDALKSFVGPEAWQAYQQEKNYNVQKDLEEDAGKQQNKIAFKAYDTLTNNAQQARHLIPNVQLALAMLNDPRMHTGLLSGAQDAWSRLKAAVLPADQAANAPNETFDKLVAANVLALLRPTTQGTGQVRQAEITLLRAANASRYYGDPANRAVLEITQRSLQQLDNLDGMAQEYVNGDDVTDPITGKVLLPAGQGTRRGLDAGFNKIARTWTNANPTFSKKEVDHYNTLFTTGKDDITGQQLPEIGKPQTQQGADQNISLPTQAASALKQGFVTKFQNGQSWTLGPDGKPQQVK